MTNDGSNILAYDGENRVTSVSGGCSWPNTVQGTLTVGAGGGYPGAFGHGGSITLTFKTDVCGVYQIVSRKKQQRTAIKMRRKEQEPFLHSQKTNAFVLKVFGPIILFGIGMGVFHKNLFSWRFIFIIPFLIAGLFFLTLAVVRVRNKSFQFRRLFNWENIDLCYVRECGILWPGLIGYIRLSYSVLPWGKLYFVLDENSDPNPLRKGHHQLLQYLEGESALHQNDVSNKTEKGASPLLRLLLSGFAGVLFYLTIQITFNSV